MKKNRETWIDMLRGIGALLVLLGHLVPETSKLKLYIYTTDYNNIIDKKESHHFQFLYLF